ncbi:MAG TPA: glycosyltransferase family 39 protein [Gemmatimonadaceae bacterium]|nr:glycosyltransferase family 39 protein [Gemmatimonadaceae bacterium]
MNDTFGDRGPRVTRVVMAIVLAGAALRLFAYMAARSLWLDEAMLANNIVGRTFVALLGPLGENQSAPWLFLFGERAATTLAGPNELALRLLPLAAGIALPYVVWLTGRRILGDTVGVVAAAITALSPLLLYYSNEVKPYGTDAVVCASLVLLTLRVLDDPHQSAPWVALLLVGVCGLWVAFPSAFVLAGCWGALVASPDARGSRHARRMLPLAVVAWGAAFAAPYFHVIRHAAHDAFLTTFFADRFLVPGHGALVSLWRLWQDVSIEVFAGRDAIARAPRSAELGLSVAILILCVLGLREVARRRGAAGVLLLAGPMAIGLVASTLRQYPLAIRLWTFSAPLWALLASAGVTSGARAVGERTRRVGAASVAALATASLLSLAVLDAALGVASPYWRRAHIRPLIRVLQAQQRTTGDAIYVTARAVPQWLFYTTAWRADPAPVERDSAAEWLEARTCSRPAAVARPCQLLGKPSSVVYREVAGFDGRPDTAWASAEVGRLRAVASPCGWVLMHLPYPGEPAALAAAFAAQGGRVDDALEDREHPNREAATKAFRVCFDSTVRPM